MVSLLDMTEGLHPSVDKQVSQEAEPQRPILIAYRENDLFVQAVPHIVKMLDASGRSVEIKAYPQGSSIEDIKEDWKKVDPARMEELVSRYDVVSDYTVGEVIANAAAYVKTEAAEYFQIRSLDAPLLDAARATITNEPVASEESDSRKSEQAVGELFTKLMRRILSGLEGKAVKVFIAANALDNHDPFFTSLGERMNSPTGCEQAAETIRKWIEEAGLDSSSVTIIPKLIEFVRNQDSLLTEDSIVIADRHMSDVIKQIRTKNVLKMPLANFVRSAYESGLLVPEGDIESQQQQMERVIRNYFAIPEPDGNEEVR